MYSIERRGRAYQVRQSNGTAPAMVAGFVVFGPRRKRDCVKFVKDRQAIEANPRLQRLQRLAQSIVEVPALVNALKNQTCHALENQAAASRGEPERWAFHYSGECMTDPKDVTSEKGAMHALRCAWVELVDLGVDDYPGAIRDPLYDAVPFDCGHLPESRGVGQMNEAGDSTGRTMCYACADARHVQDLDTDDRTGGYLTGEPGSRIITTWTGGMLMHVIKAESQGKRWAPGAMEPYERWTIHAVDAKKRLWKGTGMGPGMLCRLRKTDIVRGRRVK